MAGLPYVGARASAPTDLANWTAAKGVVDALAPSKDSVVAQVNSAGGGVYASKTYVDSQDLTFTNQTYYQGRDALNIPLTANPNNSSGGGYVQLTSAQQLLTQNSAVGVASLDSGGKVPTAQMPNMGVGYVLGPFGHTAAVSSATATGSTKVKIADWNIGVQNTPFRPKVFFQAWTNSTNPADATIPLWGQPVIELRISDSTTAPTDYASTTLIAQGVGRYLYNDPQPVTVVSAPSTTGLTPSSLDPNYHIWISAWLYDLQGRSVSIGTMNPQGITNSSVYLIRDAA